MRNYRKILIDFHTPEFLAEVGGKFDPVAWIKTLKNAEIQVAAFYAKDHYGNSYYPTSVGHRHKRINYDLFGSLVTEANRSGLKAVAYYSIGWDNWGAENYPSWRVLDSDGAPLVGPSAELTDYNHPNIWHHVCFNSPYRQYVLEQMKEISQGYEIEGFWLDILGFFGESCYCPFCQEKFRKQFNSDIPRKDAPSSQKEQFRRWKENEIREFVTEIKDSLSAIRKSLLLGINSVITEDIDFFPTEFHPPAYTTQSLMARKLRSMAKDKPFEVLISRNINAHGEWTLKPLPMLQYELATILANGGEAGIVDQAYPEGTLEEGVYKVIQKAYRWAMKRDASWEGESLPDIAILDFTSSCCLQGFSPSVKGLAKAAMEGGYHLDVLGTLDSLEQIAKYAAVLVPGLELLSPPQVAVLCEYEKAGGTLLFTCQDTSLAREKLREDASLCSLLGIEILEEGEFTVNYFDLSHKRLAALAENYPKESLSIPLLIKERVLKVRAARGAEVLGTFVFPAVETSDTYFISHQLAPPARSTDYPAFILGDYGKGKSVFIPTPVGSGYWETAFPWLRRIILLALEVLTKDKRPVQVVAPCGVETVFVKQGSSTIIHLIDFSTGRPHGIPWQTRVLPLPPEDTYGRMGVKIRIKKEVPVEKVHLASSLRSLKFKDKGKFWEIAVPRFRIHEAVVIHTQPA